MTTLAIIAGLLLLLVLLFFASRIKIVISYNGSDGLYFGVSILSFRVFSTKEKEGEPRVKISDFSLGKLSKRSKKDERKRKKREKKQKAPGERPSVDIGEIIKLIRVIISTFFNRYSDHLSVRAVRLKIGVATGDAASTAILYGLVIQGVTYLFELLDNVTSLEKIDTSEVNVYPDYTSDSSTADIKIHLKLPTWCAAALVYRSGILKSL